MNLKVRLSFGAYYSMVRLSFGAYYSMVRLSFGAYYSMVRLSFGAYYSMVLVSCLIQSLYLTFLLLIMIRCLNTLIKLINNCLFLADILCRWIVVIMCIFIKGILKMC